MLTECIIAINLTVQMDPVAELRVATCPPDPLLFQLSAALTSRAGASEPTFPAASARAALLLKRTLELLLVGVSICFYELCAKRLFLLARRRSGTVDCRVVERGNGLEF